VPNIERLLCVARKRWTSQSARGPLSTLPIERHVDQEEEARFLTRLRFPTSDVERPSGLWPYNFFKNTFGDGSCFFSSLFPIPLNKFDYLLSRTDFRRFEIKIACDENTVGG
jgi:hypothetical protein